MSATGVEEKQAPRLSRMAVLSFLSGAFAFVPGSVYIVDPCPERSGLALNFMMVVVVVVLGLLAVRRIRRSQGTLKGLGFARVGVALGIMILVFSTIGKPNLISTGGPRPQLVASQAKTAATQAIVYAMDKGVYPTSLKVLREAGYGNVPDKDPWGNDWVLSPVLTRGSAPREGDNVYVFSRGPKGTGVYPQPFTSKAGEGGSVGYSSVYGSWRRSRVCHAV